MTPPDWLAPEPNDYDEAARLLVRRHPFVLPWLLDEPADEVAFGGWLDTRRLTFPSPEGRTNDLVAKYTLAGEGGLPRLAIVEVEYRPTPRLAGRLLVYLGYALNDLNPTDLTGDEYAVTSVVVALSGRANANRDTRTKRGRGVLIESVQHSLAHLNASDVLTGVADGTIPWPFLSWVPLTNGAADPSIRERFLERFEALPPEADRGLIKLQTLAYAELPKTADIWRDWLKEVNVIRSQIMEEVREGFRQEWRRIGREEGGVHTARAMLVSLIEARFGPASPEVVARLDAIADADRLQALVPAIVAADSPDAVLAALS